MERMDEQILPAVYNAIGASFHATPSQLGVLTLARALVQALASPLGGILGATQPFLEVKPPGRPSVHSASHASSAFMPCCSYGTCMAARLSLSGP